MSSTVKDLTKEAPASPRDRVGGYIILARMADKGRATLHSNVGEYHFDCPLDNMLFGFKGVTGEQVKAQLQAGLDNEALAKWFDENGTPKTAEEIKAWGDGIEAFNPVNAPDKKEWFEGETAKLGLDASKTTLFDFLDADDKASFKA